MSASETPSNTHTSPSPPLPEHCPVAVGNGDEGERSLIIHPQSPLLTYVRMATGAHHFTSVCGKPEGAFGWEPKILVSDQDFCRTGLHPDDVPLVTQALAELPERGSCAIEYRLRAAQGAYAWYLDSMALEAGAEGTPRKIVGSLLGISRTKALEGALREQLLAARAASQVKSEFLANMSHELTTPLNAVIGFSEVLQDRYFGELTEKQAEYVATIRESGLRLLALLTDILQLAKLDAGDTVLNMDPASPAGLMRAAMEMLREKTMRHNITIELDLGPDMEQETSLDEVKFRQVLYILLGTAVKQTKDAGKVKFSGRRTGHGASKRLLVSVEDSGPGIPADFASRLFTPFAAQAVAHQGEGLGLALARQLARLQGGDVLLADTSPSGSRLEFSLPGSPATQSLDEAVPLAVLLPAQTPGA